MSQLQGGLLGQALITSLQGLGVAKMLVCAAATAQACQAGTCMNLMAVSTLASQ